MSSKWGDEDENSSSDEYSFSKKGGASSNRVSRNSRAVSTKSSHWGDTDESSDDDSKIKKFYSRNASRQPSKLSSWGDSGASSDSEDNYGGAIKPKPIR